MTNLRFILSMTLASSALLGAGCSSTPTQTVRGPEWTDSPDSSTTSASPTGRSAQRSDLGDGFSYRPDGLGVEGIEFSTPGDPSSTANARVHADRDHSTA